MEALFLNILNMSITSGYVILAVLFIRLLLKRAPKKYSYLLWSAVLFRLISPVALSSVFSLFQPKFFNMTEAQKDGPAMLRFIPSKIGYARTPHITTGILPINTFINDRLPPSTPYSSINPMQVWIWLGIILWSFVIIVLLTVSITNFIDLKCRMAAAVKLKNNVFESDKIHTPFILGLIRPRIYIPFGLNNQELAYILKHEYYHLKRKDHLIKALSYLVVILHWFNPLVWLAFICMTKDMEMSCDEKVLSETGTGIIHEYSASLLSFASNRRFPSANPLAFGETGIRERINNVLRFKKVPGWVRLLSVIICIVTVVSCAANPQMKTGYGILDKSMYGTYIFEKQVYMNPLSSFLALDGFREYYTLEKDSIVITDSTGSEQKITIAYEESPADVQEFKNSFLIKDTGTPDISRYKKVRKFTLTDSEGNSGYRIYLLDKDIWLVHIHKTLNNTENKAYIWSIYKISKYDGTIPKRP